MSKKVLVIMGHPDTKSFCAGLAESYAEGARQAGAEVRAISLSELNFDPILRMGYHDVQQLEPDLSDAQESIKWAEHIVWVYPIWWGTMPALLKGFLDRTFLPGFAFKYRENSAFWDKYLTGRSGRMIVTMDAPVWYDRLVYFGGGRRTMKKAVLEFCGIKPVGVTAFGQVKSSDEAKRKKWIGKVRELGKGLK
ncbi:MAG: NAD(P)H-dependent oxidoreductase [Pyrinomonadaceae bacterium]|nr:NAD(P)H-dependent oxidoreductase [Pyrinomonadaceae bacterium]MBP6213463.1 NAD(P)H-dependent oxidoreductase [Pyrinomonadaceae bacterium]